MSHKEEVLKHVIKTVNELDEDRIESISIDVDDRYTDAIGIDIHIAVTKPVKPEEEQHDVTVQVNADEYIQKLEVVKGRAEMFADAINELNNTEINIEVDTD